MHNLEELRKRIADNSEHHKDGYICIGKGTDVPDPSLATQYGFKRSNLWVPLDPHSPKGYNWNQHWAGCNVGTRYFIKESFYNEHIKDKPIMTATEKYAQAQKSFIEISGLKVGDEVKIIAKGRDHQFGWAANWTPSMDKLVNNGTTYLVKSIDETEGFRLNNSYTFPFFCLEVVGKAKFIGLESGDYEVQVKESGDIKVGCQDISYEKLKEIFDAATKNKNS